MARKKSTTTKQTAKKAEPASFFFMNTVLVVYEKDETPRQRTMNILLEVSEPSITKSGLGEIQKNAMQRIHEENGVDSDMLRDVVITNTCLLGHMTQEEFHGNS